MTKYNAAGNAYLFSTYLSGNVDDAAYAAATDSFGNTYVTGETFGEAAAGVLSPAANFPVTSDAAQSGANQFDLGLSDAFVTKFNPVGSLVYSTRIGGGGRNTTDRGTAIAVDSAGYAYVTGFAKDTSTPFPTRRATQETPPGLTDAFVAKINPAGSDWDYSTYLGGRERHGLRHRRR